MEMLMTSSTKQRRFAMISIVAILVCGRVATALGSEVVVPNSNDAVEGNSSSSLLNLTNSTASEFKFQQVYDASEFGSSRTVITRIAFRPSESAGHAFSSTTLRDFVAKLSTTSKSVDGLSSTYSENPGPDEITVFSGDLTIASNNIGSPPAFDIIINLAVPFMYDPNLGNLLLEIQNPAINNFTSTTSIDAVSTIGDSVSIIVGNVNDDVARFNFSFGNVTRFTTVPESPSIGLLALAMLSAFSSRFRTRLN